MLQPAAPTGGGVHDGEEKGAQMRSNARWEERIGAVFLPEADVIEVVDDDGPSPAGPGRAPRIPGPVERPELPEIPRDPVPLPVKRCFTTLKQGCYTVQHTPKKSGVFTARFRGTLRVELTGGAPRVSGDFYRYRLIDPSVIGGPVLTRPALVEQLGVADDVADDAPTIPIYTRKSYNSYLRGTRAQLVTLAPKGSPCWFGLEFDQFTYQHPASGFNGSFDTTPNRRVRFTLNHTSTPDLFTGSMYLLPASGSPTLLGSVSIRWISPFFRRADLQINTLTGAATPPTVGGSHFGSIFADAGWDVTVTDGGTISLPPELSGISTTECWSMENLHTLMTSVPGYNPAELDSRWRVHLVAVPNRMGCSRGHMFDTSGSDANAVPREGAATYSHDGYPASETVHYDAAADQQQRNVPRAFLRSATHEVGHAFNQIHQNFEGGNDNSIMTPTPGVAAVLGTTGTFPDGITLAFNDTVKRHLRHYPDPAVRPGGMSFFGSAVSAPEPADVDWANGVRVDVTTSAERVRLGEPITLRWTLVNAGEAPVPVPDRIDVESQLARVSVTDPAGRITFMRPEVADACFTYRIVPLEPGSGVEGSTTLFWGREGFAFETPGRHRIEVVVLWQLAGAPIAASGEAEVFVTYPLTEEDNEVAALMLDPDVGRAVARGDTSRFAGAAERVRSVLATAGSHPAGGFLREAGIAEPAPAKAPAKKRGARKRRG